jgi:type I restriction enzyme, S subunit
MIVFLSKWDQVPLMEVVDLHDSRRVPLNNTERAARKGPYPYYGANGQVDTIDGFLFDGDYVLLAEDGGYFDDPSRGVAYEVTGKFWVNNHAHILSPKPTIIRRFLTYVLNHQDWMPYVGGSTRLKLTQESMRRVRIPLPPLVEQGRIVAKLDSLLGSSKNARDELSHIPGLVERYRQAVLESAFRGDLTASWGANRKSGAKVQNLSDRWTKHSLFELCDPRRGITYGVIKLGEEVADGIPCLRTSNVRWLRIDTDWVKKISPALSSDYARTILRGGEVLVNVRGTLGGVAVATPDMAGWNVSREVAVVPVDIARYEPAYVAYWIGASASQRWLNRMEKGVAYTGVNLEDLRKLPIDVPSIEEQREIVRRVSATFLQIDSLLNESARAKALVERLDQAALEKAFRGELLAPSSTEQGISEVIREPLTEAPGGGRRQRISV